MGTIHIENLQVFANHGVFPEENKLGQKFLVSLDLFSDFTAAALTDDIEQSTNYGEVCSAVTEYLQTNTFKLIESAAEYTAQMLLEKFPLLNGVKIELKKPWAPIGLPLDTVSVTVERSWHTAYIALGSNMGNKEKHLRRAVTALDTCRGCRVEKVSSLITTSPYGGIDQDDFLNGALLLKTYLSPEELLTELHRIESEAHRERLVRWGPRTLDLDILMYDHLVLDTEDLHIPHIDMHNRDFVLQPLAEIAPFVRHPVLNRTVQQLNEELKARRNQ